MKTGKTLPDLEAELKRQCGMKRDFLAPARLLNVRSNGHTDLAWSQEASSRIPVNANAHSAGRRSTWGSRSRFLRVPANPRRDTLRVPVIPAARCACSTRAKNQTRRQLRLAEDSAALSTL